MNATVGNGVFLRTVVDDLAFNGILIAAEIPHQRIASVLRVLLSLAWTLPMDRRAEILRYVDRDQLGIEIGPWHSPLAPKVEGFNCLSMDVFDTETLRRRAAADPAIPVEQHCRIEHVDLIGGAGSLGELAEQHNLLGKIDYVISSHNIEHIPDPIGFFRDCALVLKPGGYVSMAVPDRRACFDFFRPYTSLSQWIEANFASNKRPTYAQVFELACLGAEFDRNGIRSAGFDIDNESPGQLVPFNRMEAALLAWRNSLAELSEEYHDTHCWAFTPRSFELLMRDCRYLGLSSFDVVEVTPVNVHEFYVHLRSGVEKQSDASYLDRRAGLLHAVVLESASNALGQVRRDELARVQAEAERLRALVAETSRQLQHQQEMAGLLNARIDGLESSTSWKITSPIRALKALFQ